MTNICHFIEHDVYSLMLITLKQVRHMNVINFFKMVDNLLSGGHFVKSAEADLKIVRTQVRPEDGTNLAPKLSTTLATMPGRHFEGVA